MLQMQVQINDDGSMAIASAIDGEPLQTIFWSILDVPAFVDNPANKARVEAIRAYKAKVDAIYPDLIETAKKHEQLELFSEMENALVELKGDYSTLMAEHLELLADAAEVDNE